MSDDQSHITGDFLDEGPSPAQQIQNIVTAQITELHSNNFSKRKLEQSLNDIKDLAKQYDGTTSLHIVRSICEMNDRIEESFQNAKQSYHKANRQARSTEACNYEILGQRGRTKRAPSVTSIKEFITYTILTIDGQLSSSPP